MAKLIGISGSLRRGSFNTALLRAATKLVPSGAQLVTETLHGVPLYDGDVETAQGLPQRVTELKEAIAAADGLLLATPEYNNRFRAFSRTRWIGCRAPRPIFPGSSEGSQSP